MIGATAAMPARPANCAAGAGRRTAEAHDLRRQGNLLHAAGEGALTGRPSVFCRFSGCNLWTGREEDRADAVCTFCDTDFVGMDGTVGGRYRDADALADRIASLWPDGAPARFVVCTGGEPLLQLDPPLIAALHARDFAVAIETNGTIPPPDGI